MIASMTAWGIRVGLTMSPMDSLAYFDAMTDSSLDEFMAALSPTSKYNADWEFLVSLRDQGRKCASNWLANNFIKLGVESSLDIDKLYL
jgi:hypothetical protein